MLNVSDLLYQIVFHILKFPATTTTTTVAPFPCTVCQPVYDTTCQGLGIPNLLTGCPTALEAGIDYVFNTLNALFPIAPPNSCSTIVICPPTTTLEYIFLGNPIIGPSPVLAWCEETGPDAGTWYAGVSIIARFELASLACRPIIPG
uniref:Uncharacterized protein n=1 Tax=Caenorhabditis tropicalis TaxID=1561998 RepID=A0A1I7TJC3_9PELO